MHHPAVNEVRTISKNKDDFIQVCEDNGVEVVLTGHTHLSKIYDKNFELYDEEVYCPINCSNFDNTFYVQTRDCGKESAHYRKIEISGDDVIIFGTDSPYSLFNIYLKGPGDIHVYNTVGNHIGKNTKDKPESNIQGATYGHLDSGEEFASLYLGQESYTIEIEGITNGTISVTLEIIDKNGNCDIISYEDIQISKNSKITLRVNENLVDYNLYLDYENDKKIDTILKPIIDTNKSENEIVWVKNAKNKKDM